MQWKSVMAMPRFLFFLWFLASAPLPNCFNYLFSGCFNGRLCNGDLYSLSITDSNFQQGDLNFRKYYHKACYSKLERMLVNNALANMC